MGVDAIPAGQQVPPVGRFCYSGVCQKQATKYILVDVQGTSEWHPRCDDHLTDPWQWGEPLVKIGDPIG